MRHADPSTALGAPGIEPNIGFDPGPPKVWEEVFLRAPLDEYQKRSGRHFHHAFGPVFYRGRLDGTARVLLIGQDPSIDELFARRVLVGRSGQRVQGLLRKAGLDRQYIMVNTFLFSVRHGFDAALRAICLEPAMLAYRNSILDKIVRSNRIEAIVAMGDAAQLAVQHWPGSERSRTPVIPMAHPTLGSLGAEDDATILQNWNATLRTLRMLVAPEVEPDDSYYGDCFSPAVMANIPRQDLPFGMPSWLGTGGTRGVRSRGNRITWTAPE